MKRFLAMIAALITLSLCTTIPVPAGDHPAVGQHMPDMKAFINENHVNTVQRVTPYPDGRILLTHNMYKQSDEGAQFLGVMAFMKCPNGEGTDVPFGVCLATPQGGILLLDNAPTDGIIDEVVINPVQRKILDDMPSCL